MSNKPKIYANCKAGCLWETVHKDDFQRSAAFIKQNVTDNGSFKEFNLEAGQTCILKGDIFGDNWLFKPQIEIRDANNNRYHGPIGFSRKPWDTCLIIENCGVQPDPDNYNRQTIFYKIKGDRGGLIERKYSVDDKTAYLRLLNVDEVYLVNDAVAEILTAEEVSV